MDMHIFSVIYLHDLLVGHLPSFPNLKTDINSFFENISSPK